MCQLFLNNDKDCFLTVAIKKPNGFYHKVVFSLTSSASAVFSHDIAVVLFQIRSKSCNIIEKSQDEQFTRNYRLCVT